MKIKKGDQVTIVIGKDKGKQGKVLKVLTKEDKVLVEGVNQYKRHMKARTQNQKSEIITLTKPLPVANVAFVCPKCKKEARIGYTMEGKEKMRVCKRCGKTI
ncbi:MAG: 50S ribosomal protein L24 [Candidatus Levybacteria bacterium]|nr:50S ribosomal protein L24 [Candidatus Levybacteria bacterium]